MKFKIASARLSFPALFQTAKFGGEDTGKYECTLILDKVQHAEVIKAMSAAIANMMKDELKGKIPSEKIALKDGDESDRPEFAGKMTLKVSSKRRPLVINRDKSPITEADNIVYAGCYVNAIVSLWPQNNQWGKRINGSLEGIQFAKDGEPFGDGGASVNEFDAFGASEEDECVLF